MADTLKRLLSRGRVPQILVFLLVFVIALLVEHGAGAVREWAGKSIKRWVFGDEDEGGGENDDEDDEDDDDEEENAD